MNRYRAFTTEIVRGTVEVTANSVEEALEQIHALHNDGLEVEVHDRKLTEVAIEEV